MTVKALLDSGAQQTVIDKALSDALGGNVDQKATEINGRRVSTMNATTRVRVRGCEEFTRAVAIDDQMASLAGKDARMIIGSDHMQDRRMRLLFSNIRGKDRAAYSKSGRRR